MKKKNIIHWKPNMKWGVVPELLKNEPMKPIAWYTRLLWGIKFKFRKLQMWKIERQNKQLGKDMKNIACRKCRIAHY